MELVKAGVPSLVLQHREHAKLRETTEELAAVGHGPATRHDQDQEIDLALIQHRAERRRAWGNQVQLRLLLQGCADDLPQHASKGDERDSLLFHASPEVSFRGEICRRAEEGRIDREAQIGSGTGSGSDREELVLW